MSKASSTICITALLLLFALTCAARSGPPFSDATPMKTQHEDVNEVEVEGINCEGVGEEECLMRRTLAAHVDYIYTQKQNP
ncbi:hypothetical protein RHMOL_Rhmol11G0226300 [Rhododendron molle]|uniref:Uncharacterized protein n=1 Tax=Rhododendron molle TaxID=49168 RepID=A0ACC0LV54_RHOML|nr:hypothetical protein RHMOL_Rhmol11G0226300 [Rhododendron molle]